MSRRRRGSRSQRGAAAVELTLLVPAVLVLIGLILASGRVWFARTAVADAAQASARAATLARTSGQASADARQEARRALATAGLECADTSVSIDLGAFGAAPGTPANVHTALRCRVTFGDLVLPGLSGSMTLTAEGVSALDTYRARS